MNTLRVLLADDERPARRFLLNLLQRCEGTAVVAEAANGSEALTLIQQHKPDLALLDLQMPDMTGLEVTRLLEAGAVPMIAFVTAFDEFAVEAFELNAIDYLLKPVELERLRATLDRARTRARLQQAERARNLQRASSTLDLATRRSFLERIPVRTRDEVVLVPVRHIASVIAEGELLHLTTLRKDRYTISYRLHALESKLDPRRFVRLGRGTLAAVDAIDRVNPMPGGTYEVTLTNGQQLPVSRLQSRVLRETLLKL